MIRDDETITEYLERMREISMIDRIVEVREEVEGQHTSHLQERIILSLAGMPDIDCHGILFKWLGETIDSHIEDLQSRGRSSEEIKTEIKVSIRDALEHGFSWHAKAVLFKLTDEEQRALCCGVILDEKVEESDRLRETIDRYIRSQIVSTKLIEYDYEEQRNPNDY